MAYPTILISSTSTKAAGNNFSGIDGTITNASSGGVAQSDDMGAVAQSSNGRYVVFVSAATNFTAPGVDTNNGGDTSGGHGRDIFIKDVVTGEIKRVSTADGNFEIDNSDSNFYAPEVSDDGRYVLFETKINIVESGLGAGNSVIYRKDLVTGDLEVASKTDGDVAVYGSSAHMSNDGRYVVFTSSDGTDDQVYLRDLQEGTTTLVSADTDGITAGNGNSSNAYISADNKFVVFESEADNFSAGNSNAGKEVFLKNIVTGELSRVSENANGEGGANGFSANASISGNGRYAVFESGAEDFIPLTGDFTSLIYRKDLLTGEIDLVSERKKPTDGIALVGNYDATISDDGRFVLFKTFGQVGANPSATANNFLYIKDMANGDLYGIDVARSKITMGAGGFSYSIYESPFQSYSATLSADGKYVTLTSTQKLSVAGNVSGNDGQYDVFRIDVSSITKKAATVQTIKGTDGDDTLTGGMGKDKLIGYIGGDVYSVELIQSGTGAKAAAVLKYKVIEAADQGDDTISLFGSVAGLTKASNIKLIPNVENLDASATGDTWLNLTGNTSANTLTGNAANNILTGGKGEDSFEGGNGDDTYVLDLENEIGNITENVNEGTDTIQITYANTSKTIAKLIDLSGLEVENVKITSAGLFNITGNDLNNSLTGTAAINSIDGGNGNDSLIGLAGNDILNGDDGEDTLEGGTGLDNLTGGLGDDTFVFNLALTKTSIDTITDFESGSDTIQLDKTIFAKLLLVGDLNADNFKTGEGIPTRSNVDIDDRIYYDTISGSLYYDKDGSGSAAAVKFATLTGAPALESTDFAVVA